MADSAIGNLPAAETIGSSDLFVLEQGGAAKKLPGSLLTQFIDRNMVNVSVTIVPSTQSGGGSYNSTTGVLTLNIPEGNGIFGLALVSTSGNTDTYRLTYEDGSYNQFTVTNGSSIASIAKTSTSGLTDTYTITLTNGQTSTFTVTNGSGGVDTVAGVQPGSGGDVAKASLATALLPELRIVETNKALSSISWTSDATYTDYPYYTDVSVTGVTANHFAEVVFAPADAGDFAPVCQTGSGTVRIWCSGNSRSSMTIPTIFAWR